MSSAIWDRAALSSSTSCSPNVLRFHGPVKRLSVVEAKGGDLKVKPLYEEQPMLQYKTVFVQYLCIA